jgi:hypothetical protein
MNPVMLLAAFLTLSGGFGSALGSPTDATPARCSVGPLRDNPEGYFWPLANIQEFVARSELIVRARATERLPWHAADSSIMLVPPNPLSIAFEVLEVLKGDSTVVRIGVAGDTLSHDDFNHTTTVPYRTVRPNGQRGMCVAMYYKLGGEFLLLLARDTRGRLTPYWAPLAPLNEQVRGKDDPWVVWVRAQIR